VALARVIPPIDIRISFALRISGFPCEFVEIAVESAVAVRSRQEEGLGDRAEARSIRQSFRESGFPAKSPDAILFALSDPVDLRCGDAMSPLFDPNWSLVLPLHPVDAAKQQEATHRLERAAPKTNLFEWPSSELKSHYTNGKPALLAEFLTNFLPGKLRPQLNVPRSSRADHGIGSANVRRKADRGYAARIR
jgi:hypothetical protein